ncbi:BA75_01208T0 [Komagataella pastoris]|uniref:BA75_01208T0 n=1 Tax=Komagataella pastoris TaxID=4922 RepID=A0A1B2J7D8_PICPA|nr:BA75_01208T0 [Komagataella pastoris]
MTSSPINPNNDGNKSSLSLSSMRSKLQRTKQRITSIPKVTTSPRKKASSTSSSGSNNSSNGNFSIENQHNHGNNNSNNREEMLVDDFALRYESFSDEDSSRSPRHAKSTSVDTSRSRSKSLSRSVSISSSSSILVFSKSKVVSPHESVVKETAKMSSSVGEGLSQDPVLNDSLLPPIPMDKPSNHEELHPTLPTSVIRGNGLLPPHTCSRDHIIHHHMSDSSTATMSSVSTMNEILQPQLSPAIQNFSIQTNHKSSSISSASSVLAKPNVEDVLASEDALATAILKQVNNGESWEL